MLYDTTDGIFQQNQHSSRMLSRGSLSRSSQPPSNSSQTVLTAVQRFVSSVDTMNETIMVPCRLLDMEVHNNENRPVPELLRGEKDFYAVYGLLNSTKNDLMYGLPTNDEDEPPKQTRIQDPSSDRWSTPCETSSDTASTSSINSNNATHANITNTNSINNNSSSNTTSKQQQPLRRTSTLSMISVRSTSSDSLAENDITEEVASDRDSCVGSDETSPTNVVQASSELRDHLIGLYSCLTQLSDTAVYISDRYQEDISE